MLTKVLLFVAALFFAQGEAMDNTFMPTSTFAPTPTTERPSTTIRLFVSVSAFDRTQFITDVNDLLDIEAPDTIEIISVEAGEDVEQSVIVVQAPTTVVEFSMPTEAQASTFQQFVEDENSELYDTARFPQLGQTDPSFVPPGASEDESFFDKYGVVVIVAVVAVVVIGGIIGFLVYRNNKGAGSSSSGRAGGAHEMTTLDQRAGGDPELHNETAQNDNDMAGAGASEDQPIISDDLPPGWSLIPNDGDPYYWHAETEESRWTKPEMPNF